jgi:hypothetical protein
MNLLTQLTAAQLREAANIQEKIQGLQSELAQVLGAVAAPSATFTTEARQPAKKPKRRFSARTRAKMAEAQRARWAAKRGEVGPATEPGATPAATPEKTQKKKVSKAKLRALAKAREARWAKVRAAKKAPYPRANP